jgi:hypothetical protein
LAIWLRSRYQENSMSEAAHPAQHDFWRPPVHAVSETAHSQELASACERCETEFIVGSRFCHHCGASRSESNAATHALPLGFEQVTTVAARLDLSVGAFIAFALGVLFLVFALGVSFVFSARTALDWQAIQLWRIQWLLASVAAFVAGCLLKRSR